MIFECEKYYKYIQTLEKTINAYYVIIILLGVLIGATINLISMILYGLIGFFIANIITFRIKIQIQKMKWEIDIYNKITEKI